MYNNGTNYGEYKDNRPFSGYLEWISGIFCQLERVMKPSGSFFLNLGWSASNPWFASDVANEARKAFVLQNKIAWIKSIAIGDEPCQGHLKPVNSLRFLNRQWEEIYHFTKNGKQTIDRLSIGIPYADLSNLERGTRGKNGNKRCRGDTWFLPYLTTNEYKGHPCPFPELLVERCLRLHGGNDLMVLDPFAGGCTTALVAAKLGMGCVSIDSNSDYINAGINKLRISDQQKRRCVK